MLFQYLSTDHFYTENTFINLIYHTNQILKIEHHSICFYKEIWGIILFLRHHPVDHLLTVEFL